MNELASQIGLAAAAFASTNIDDVVLLLALFSSRAYSTRQIVIGQYLGMSALFAVSILASFVSLVLPSAYLGLLGLVPIAIGTKQLLHLLGKRGVGATDGRPPEPSTSTPASIFSVATATIANGGDNIGLYTPIFVFLTVTELAVFGFVFAILTGVWCFVAHGLIKHSALREHIQRYGHRIAPVVLIALGLLVLRKTLLGT